MTKKLVFTLQVISDIDSTDTSGMLDVLSQYGEAKIVDVETVIIPEETQSNGT